jgi:uroporphyrin-III C-methyltransferase
MNINPPASSASRPIEGGASFLVGYQLAQRHVLVIGGGKEAANRTFFALDSDAFVTVIAPPPLHPAVQARYQKGLLRWINREFIASDLEMPWKTVTNSEWPVDMVLGCIDDHQESRRIALLCRSKRIPVNCADIPELCDFYFMAQFRQEKLQIAVSTNGCGPRVGVRIRNRIVQNLDPSTPKAVTMIGKLREKIRTVDETELSVGSQGIQSRMGWVSRFCDSWSFKQLTSLEDPVVMEEIIDCFRKGKSVPESNIADDSLEPSTILPAALTSYWWCPKNMGYFPWLNFVGKYYYRLGYQVTRLLFLHVSLPFKSQYWFPSHSPVQQYSSRDPVPVVVSTCVVPNQSGEIVEQNRDISNLERPAMDSTNTTAQNQSSQSDEVVQVTCHSQASVLMTDNESQTPNAHAQLEITEMNRLSLPSVTEPLQLGFSSSNQVHIPSSAVIVADIETQTIAPVVLSTDVPQSNVVLPPVTIARSECSDDTLDINSTGKVYLVGAGPGHPDMLTLQAFKILQLADLVVSDRLIPKEIQDLIPLEKLVLSSFKVGGKSDKSQDESNEICLHAAQEGKNVVRLKTGDPFVFGRGGEEILFFRHYDIEAIVVPGLSSVFAAPTVSNIPVTHREVADQVLILTGRGKGGSFPHIPHFYANRTTIFLMSLSRVEELANIMADKDYPLDIPCAVIQKGTWLEGQSVCYGTLKSIGNRVKEQKIENPAMLIVGDVISVLEHPLF